MKMDALHYESGTPSKPFVIPSSNNSTHWYYLVTDNQFSTADAKLYLQLLSDGISIRPELEDYRSPMSLTDMHIESMEVLEQQYAGLYNAFEHRVSSKVPVIFLLIHSWHCPDCINVMTVL